MTTATKSPRRKKRNPNHNKKTTRKKLTDGMVQDTILLPKEGKRLDVYADFILKLQTETQFFSRNLGHRSWCQGQVLLMARKQVKKKGDWGRFLSAVKISPETGRLLRRIAERVTVSQAKTLTYVEMLRIVYPSFKKTLADDANNDFGNATGKGKGKRNNVDHNLRNPQPLPILAFEKQLKTVLSTTQRLGLGILDSHMDPSDTVKIIRDCVRMAKSAKKELSNAETRLQEEIANLSTTKKKDAA